MLLAFMICFFQLKNDFFRFYFNVTFQISFLLNTVSVTLIGIIGHNEITRKKCYPKTCRNILMKILNNRNFKQWKF